MIVPDVNLLLHAYTPTSSSHKKALLWLQSVLSGEEPVGLPWQVISAFLRIVTNRKLPGFGRPIEEATAIIEDWLKQPNVHLLTAGDAHWMLFRRMMLEGQASGDLVSDAHLAALTVEHGGVLYTTDRDFARFPGLRWENPIAERS